MSWQIQAAIMLKEILIKEKNEVDKESEKITSFSKKVLRYPIKLIATFIFAPFLLIKIALHSDTNLLRKCISIFGLILAGLGAYFLQGFAIVTLLALIKTHLGWFSFIFTAATLYISIWLNVLIQISIFNSVSTLVLRLNQHKVLKYLNELVEGNG